MIFVSFLVGCLFGWYIAHRKHTQINKPYSSDNIQIGSIKLKVKEKE